MADPQGIDEKAPPLTFTQWLICFTAAMGFAFDVFALLVLPRYYKHYMIMPGVIIGGIALFYVALMIRHVDVDRARRHPLHPAHEDEAHMQRNLRAAEGHDRDERRVRHQAALRGGDRRWD